MKQLQDYIQEKLHISQYKKENKLFNRIIDLFTLPKDIRENKNLIQSINDWIDGKLEHNKKPIDEVVPIAYPIVIDIMKDDGVKKEITSEFERSNSVDKCDLCYYEYEKTYILWYNDRYEIRYNERILIFTDEGTANYRIYLVRKESLGETDWK